MNIFVWPISKIAKKNTETKLKPLLDCFFSKKKKNSLKREKNYFFLLISFLKRDQSKTKAHTFSLILPFNTDCFYCKTRICFYSGPHSHQVIISKINRISCNCVRIIKKINPILKRILPVNPNVNKCAFGGKKLKIFKTNQLSYLDKSFIFFILCIHTFFCCRCYMKK